MTGGSGTLASAAAGIRGTCETTEYTIPSSSRIGERIEPSRSTRRPPLGKYTMFARAAAKSTFGCGCAM